ncbi:MAG: KTSC domain-containing protein [Variibacter sp.]
MIRSTRYDSARRILTVRFVTGRVYVYAGVPRPVYDAFRAAPSKGRFFNAHIRNVYRYREQTAA